MRFTLKKDEFKNIDDAFNILKSINNDTGSLFIIKKSLEACFKYQFDVRIVNVWEKTNNAWKKSKTPLFIMSVLPEVSTVDKIVTAISNDSIDELGVKELWEKNKSWIIEIDSRILDKNIIDIDAKELTAILLHEIGHIVYSNSIPSRINTILRYELAKSSVGTKRLLKYKIFTKLLSLPILNACIADRKIDDNNIRQEVKADEFVKKMGYRDELVNVLKKISHAGRTNRNAGSIDKNMVKMLDFSKETIDQLTNRYHLLVKENFERLADECLSPTIKSVIIEFTDSLFKGDENTSVTMEKKIDNMYRFIDKAIDDEYMTEFFIFKNKTLKKIDSYELDYIEMKIGSMKTESDRLMISSYIHSKIDLVNYYITILNDPIKRKKYIIPHSIEQLEAMKRRLIMLSRKAVSEKLKQRNNNILVAWPTGYEG